MKRRMRMIAALALSAMMALTAAGCGKKEIPAPASAQSEGGEVKAAVEETAEAVSETPEVTEEPTPEPEPVTASSLAAEAAAKIKDVNSYAYGVAMGFDTGITVKAEGMTMSMDIVMQMDMDYETTLDPLAAHMVGEMTMQMGEGEDGYSESEKSEFYIVPEDGSLTRYSTTDGGLNWTKEATNAEDLDTSDLRENEVLNKIADGSMEAALDEETTDFNGQEVYVIRTTLKGDQLGDTLEESTGGSADDMLGEDIDWSQVEAPLMLYINKETGMPAGMEMDLTSLGETMLTSMLGIDDSIGDVTMDMRKFNIIVSYSDFDSIGEIVVPEEIKNMVDAG